MSRLHAVLARLVALIVLSVGVVPAAQAQAPLPIRIGYQAAGSEWIFNAARTLKLFEKEGLAPAYVLFVAGPPMIGAVESGSIDVAGVGIVPFLRGLAQGVDWVLISLSEGAYSEGVVARQGLGIRTPADLRGKRIGYLKGSTAQFGLMMTLRQYGIRQDEVTAVDLTPAEQLAALKNKEIDAAMTWEPWIHKMVHEANAKVVVREGDLGIYMNTGGFAVRRDWLRENRETAVRLLRALLEAYDAVQKDRSVAIREGAMAMGISETWAEEIFQDVPPARMHLWADPRYRFSLVKGAALHRRLGYLAEILFVEGVLPKRVDVSESLDASIASEALRTRKQGP